MTRKSSLFINKKKIKSKKQKEEWTRNCDNCGMNFKREYLRTKPGIMCAAGDGVFYTISDTIKYFCSEKCKIESTVAI